MVQKNISDEKMDRISKKTYFGHVISFLTGKKRKISP